MIKYIAVQILALFLVAVIVFAADAGTLEDLSQASDWTHSFWQNDKCSTKYDERRANEGLNKAALICPTLPSDLQHQSLNLSEIANKVDESAEDKFIGLLAKKQATELNCSADFSNQVSSGLRSDVLDGVSRSLTSLRALKQQIVISTHAIMQNSDISNKVCPGSIDDLKPTPPAYLNGQRDIYFEECQTLIQSRAAYAEIMNSVPLANLPPIRDMLDSYANGASGKDESNADVKSLVGRAFASASDVLKSEASKVSTAANKSGGAAFDRKARYTLLSDPRMVSDIIKNSDDSPDVKNLFCSVDARFHKGADALDTNIFIASAALGGVGGLSFKVGSTALKVAELTNSARAGGLISTNGMRILKVASLVSSESVNALGSYSGIVEACSSDVGPNWVTHSLGKQSNCLSIPSVDQVKRDSCILNKTLAILGSKVTSAALKPLISAGAGLGGKAAIIAAPIAKLSEEAKPLESVASKIDVASKPESLKKLEELLNQNTDLMRNFISTKPNKTTLHISFLRRDDSDFLRLALKALRDGAIDEVNAGGIVGPKVPHLLTRLASTNIKGGKQIVFKGTLTPNKLVVITRAGKMDTARRSRNGLVNFSDPHEISEKDQQEFDEAMKIMHVQEGCQSVYQTSSLLKCPVMEFEFRSGQIDQIQWKKPAF